MKKIHLDFETRSFANIQDVGAWKYAADSSTEILCLARSIDGGPIEVFDADHLKGMGGLDDSMLDCVMVAHSAHFEYAIYNYILHKRYGWPALWDPSRWRCTLAKAAMCNIPISLQGASAALGLKTQKDMEGRAAMQKLCKPTFVDALGFPTYNNDPKLFDILYKYCATDVETEMELDARLPDLPPSEQKVWELDLVINRRGVKADIPTVQKAVGMADTITTTLNAKLHGLTGGAVSKASRIAEIKRYLLAKGVTVDSLDKEAVVGLLNRTDVPENVKEVIKIRQQVGKSSTAKYQTILDYASPVDGRMRGMFQYHAAGTGRWGGRGPQPQNLPKGVGFKSGEVVEDTGKLTSEGFWAKHGERAMDALSAALRGCLYANEGNVLVCADYSAIEARVVLWLAGDELALGKYRMGINLYTDMAKFIYGYDVKKDTHPVEYGVGKAVVLGAGYGMGAVKFKGTCATWGIDITEDLADAAIKAYRKKYKPVVEMWYKQEEAARGAVINPGSVRPCGKVVWGMDKKREFLVCKLPSGRHLRYFRPSVKAIETPYGEKQEIHFWCAGMNGRLEENKTYGGSLVENITQATARDVMANGMLNAEAAGFPVIMHAHDEIVAEVRDSSGGHGPWDDRTEKEKLEGLVKAMCTLPPWAAGLPIAAEGWVGKRYRK